MGYLDSVKLEDVKKYEKRLYEKLQNQYSSLLDRFEAGSFEKEDIEELKRALEELK
jgi:F-type H+-transporting ATPase subunit alpha